MWLRMEYIAVLNRGNRCTVRANPTSSHIRYCTQRRLIMKIYLELDYEESVLGLWALKDLYQFNATIANDDEYLQRLQGLIKKAGDSADKLYECMEKDDE